MRGVRHERLDGAARRRARPLPAAVAANNSGAFAPITLHADLLIPDMVRLKVEQQGLARSEIGGTGHSRA